jgi:hypothetical protein
LNRPKCGNCQRAERICTYHPISQKEEYKEERASIPSKLPQREKATQSTPYPQQYSNFDSLAAVLGSTRVFGHTPEELVQNCITWFLANMAERNTGRVDDRVLQAAYNTQRSPEEHCMIIALLAYGTLFADKEPPVKMQSDQHVGLSSNAMSCKLLLAESERVRNSYDYRGWPTTITSLTSWLYACCYLELQHLNHYYIYLSEGNAQGWLLGKEHEETLLDWLFPPKKPSREMYTIATPPTDSPGDTISSC